MQNPPTQIGFAVTLVVSALVGSIPTAILASSDNGYVAGYLVLPLLVLMVVVCGGLFICSVVFIVKEKFAIGLYLLLSVFLVPTFTIGSALAAKEFAIGAYRIEPMRPMIPAIANKIVFKEGVTNGEVQHFWQNVLSKPHESGRGKMSLPGIQSIGSFPTQNGREVITFSFFENASDEQKDAIRNAIRSSPIVGEYSENVDTTTSQAPPDLDTSSKQAEARKVVNTVRNKEYQDLTRKY
ncbi:MAG: hypothetical protein WBD27_11950 [Pyrinomonadaceae bacterium]